MVPRRQSLPIDLEVQTAIEKLSPRAIEKLSQFARRGVYQLALAGEPVASDEHEQIVHDAIADTLALVVTWDRRSKMEVHLYFVVRRRISNGLRRASKRGRESLDVLDDDEHAAMPHRSSEPEVALGRAQVTQRLYRALRERAAGDPEVLSILDAYYAEESDRRAVVALTGMSVAVFVNARRRLDRMIAALPAELRLAALAAMRDTDIVQVNEMTSETND
jgi:DNA-directed RNA polymerase specialized sigma24 family protein